MQCNVHSRSIDVLTLDVFSVCMYIFRWLFSLNNSLDSDWEKEILEDEIFGADFNLAKFKLSFTKNEGE